MINTKIIAVVIIGTLSIRLLYVEKVVDKLQLQLEITKRDNITLNETITKQNNFIKRLQSKDTTSIISKYEKELATKRNDKINSNKDKDILSLVESELQNFSHQ